MRALLFRIVGAIFLLFGAVGIAVFAEETLAGNPENPVVTVTLAVELLVLGILCLVAPRRRYRLTWSAFIGVALGFLGVAMVGMGFDELLSGLGQNAAVTFVLAVLFIAAGATLVKRQAPKVAAAQPGTGGAVERRAD